MILAWELDTTQYLLSVNLNVPYYTCVRPARNNFFPFSALDYGHAE